MDTLSIILVIVCIGLIGILLWSFSRNKKSGDTVPAAEVDRLNNIITEKNNSLSQLKEESKTAEAIIAQLKEKSIEDLKVAAARIAELEVDISKALEGGADEVVKKKLAEVDKLVKKIKNLEEDLEEAESEVESLKKKTKQLQTDNSGLQEELENEVRKGKKLLTEIEEITSRLEKIEKDFAIREEALDFVKEILTAKCTSDQSITRLYQNVDSIVDYIHGDVRDNLISIYNIPADQRKTLFDTELMGWAITKKKSWIQGKTSIAFVGEFSAGKTSIVNRILSQDDPNVPRLPVSTKATTAIPTYISGGPGTYYQFVSPGKNELKSISENTFKKVNKEVLDQIKGVSSLIQYFVMTYKNPHLDKLSILDTPGFSSNDSEDAERTIGVINECDALFWVFDVNAGTVNRSSIKNIKDNLTKPLYVVINQIDTKSKSDVDAVENLIRKTLQDEGIKIESIIRFSKNEPLSAIMNPILSIKHDNSREQYLNELIQLLKDKVSELKDETKKAHQKCNSLENKQSRLVDAYNQAISALGDDCLTVYNIPQYNSRWFSEDDFRISQSQHSEFTSILTRICNVHCDTLCNKYNEQMQTTSDIHEAWSNHSEAMYNQKRLEECLENLQKKAKALL